MLAGFAACGGDDDDDGAIFPGSNDDSNGSSDGDGDDSGDDDDDSDDDGGLPSFGAGGTASLTIGDDSYEPFLANREVAGRQQLGFCRVIFGALQILGYADTADGGYVKVEMLIPPTDWESYDDGRFDPPRVQVDFEPAEGSRATYLADQERFDENSGVDDYELDGRHATGTMTLRHDFDQTLPTLQGTFDVECKD
jgi:hypothetical protein